MDGYLLGHQTRTSKVMYINSKDVSNFYGGVTTDYSYEFVRFANYKLSSRSSS